MCFHLFMDYNKNVELCLQSTVKIVNMTEDTITQPAAPHKISKTVSGKGFSQVFMCLQALQPGRHSYSSLTYEDFSSILET